MTLTEAFSSHDMDDIIDRMVLYAHDQLKWYGIKDLQGLEPLDIVQEVILKVAEGYRDWGKAKCTFPEFLFGCLKSHLSAFRKRFKTRFINEVPDTPSKNYAGDQSSIKALAFATLKADGADELELQIFECFTDGLNKPLEIATELNIDVTIINNGIKRLRRKLINVRVNIKTII
jgi:DNA-directed RNA polymerase specialized sigma24 family protein